MNTQCIFVERTAQWLFLLERDPMEARVREEENLCALDVGVVD